MDRRSFLIDAGSILTSAYVAKANWFLTNKNSAMPLLKSNKDTTKLCLAPYIRPLIFGFSNRVSGAGGRMFNA